MLVLALESSSQRGSVALTDGDGRLVAERSYEQPNVHGERLIRLVDDLLRDSVRGPSDLKRIAVGTGPGSFTGLRVGLALAHGIASGLRLPIVGVSSLRAMACGLPVAAGGIRWPVLDARRGEVFVAAYDHQGRELVPPGAVPIGALARMLDERRQTCGSSHRHWLLGRALDGLSEVAEFEVAELGDRFSVHRSDDTDFPTAAAVGRIGSDWNEEAAAVPDYIRDADAVLPNLPPSPLSKPRQGAANVPNELGS